VNEGLPHGWANTELGQFLAVRNRRVAPSDMPRAQYIGLEHVESNSNRIRTSVPTDTVRSASTQFDKGDVLYARLRPYLNKVVMPAFSGLASAEFIVFPTQLGIDNKFVLNRLSCSDFVRFACSQYEGDRPRVKFEQISKFRVALPPRAEQTRIVEKLEELLSDLDSGVAELKAAQKKLALYRQSLLKAAVDGSLTAGWRTRNAPADTGAVLLERILKERRANSQAKQFAKTKKHDMTQPKTRQENPPSTNFSATCSTELPSSWTWCRVKQAGRVQLGRQRAPQFHEGTNMVDYLRVANVFEDRIDTSDVMRMHFSPENEALFKLEFNDILLNEGQSLELVGRPAIFRDELPRACFTNTLVRFRCERSVLPDYALAVFRHYMHSGQFRQIATITTNIAHLGANRFAEMAFPLPSHEEQKEIVKVLTKRLEGITQQFECLDHSLRQSATQRQNILRAAFAGKLVPQYPEDEPASVLLERISAERTEQASAKKPKKSRRTSKTSVVA
jgi:type I restriction enzyme, S subunit